jgi:hypothetical protein
MFHMILKINIDYFHKEHYLLFLVMEKQCVSYEVGTENLKHNLHEFHSLLFMFQSGN